MSEQENLEKLVKLSCEHGWLGKYNPAKKNQEIYIRHVIVSPNSLACNKKISPEHYYNHVRIQYEVFFDARANGCSVVNIGSLNDILFGGELGFLKGLCKAKLVSINYGDEFITEYLLAENAYEVGKRLLKLTESKRVEYLVKEFL
jgi:hypothetical protein